ncbi:hypothetical protein [Lysobacter gummosus]|uniref:hypothetical protein n=1 Tax=Lysobacter gummosus TaxID=262324 RepID=UPI00362EFBD8
MGTAGLDRAALPACGVARCGCAGADGGAVVGVAGGALGRAAGSWTGRPTSAGTKASGLKPLPQQTSMMRRGLLWEGLQPRCSSIRLQRKPPPSFPRTQE